MFNPEARSRWVIRSLAVIVALVASVTPFVVARAQSGFASSTVSLAGHGFGHGRGMGQYGALGYAVDHGWTYHQILDHYYGGTTAGHVDPTTPMTVDMTSRDGRDTIVAQERGELVTTPPVDLSCTSGSPCAVRIVRTSAGHFTVYRGTSCAGGTAGWIVAAASVAASSITISSTVPTSGVRQDMLQLCENSDIRWLRGSLLAVDTGSGQATVNQLPLDSYVRGVVPRESPASWGSEGNGAGEQALDSQAVAARSYGMAENRWPWAKTCDTTSCQVYGGRAVQASDGTFSDLEGTPTYANSDSAVNNTAGEVRVFVAGGGGTAGSLARTEFSSSTGGYTAGGTFPAVADDGDATASNPNHDWTATVPVGAIEAAYGSGLGSLMSVNITQRNNLGDGGGRVVQMDLSFQNGDVTPSGNDFAATFGLKSTWFSVTNNPAVPYLALTSDGGVYTYAGASWFGSPASQGLHVTAVSFAKGPGGYWVLTSDGAVHAYGSVQSYGSVANMRLNRPPREIVATDDGHGYWIMASDGGVFSFGDAHFYGSTGAMRLNAPIIGMAASSAGYWLLGSDGGIFTFGDAHFYGSTGGMRLNAPVNAMAAIPGGYWLTASDGGIFSFGQATYAGSLPGRGISATAVGMQATTTGHGYLIATSSGHVYGFGDAVAAGGPADDGARAATVGIAYAQ